MTQQTQEPQPWETKTIKQAIKDKEKTITIQMGIDTEFKINNETYKTCLTMMDIDLDNPFVSTTLGCNDETTVNTVCQKAIDYILNNCKWKYNPDMLNWARLYPKSVKYKVFFWSKKKFFGTERKALVGFAEIVFSYQPWVESDGKFAVMV
jgi:hypothetical protein